MNILITGGSGFLGTAVIPFLVRDERIKKIFLLLRANQKSDATQRLNDLIERVFVPAEQELARKKIEVTPGDLTLPALGLNDEWRERLLEECHQIVHIGASTDFAAPIEESRRINVDGTRVLLDFGVLCREEGVLERFDYVSTAFVAGTRGGEVSEDDLSRGQGFANAYEQSKYEAEMLVRTYQNKMNIIIYRPSIVVGDSRTGFTPHFKVLYWPLQLLSRNLLPFIPCNKRARLDIVPVDYVARAMHSLLLTSEAVGQTFHLTAGRGREIQIGKFLRDVFQSTSIVKRPLISFWMLNIIRFTWLRRLVSEDSWKVCELASVYADYLRGTKVLFNSRRTEAFLKKLHIEPPPSWDSYREKILSYCMGSRWGKKLQHKEYVYRNPDYTF